MGQETREEIILEVFAVGGYLKVTAIDSAGREGVAIGPLGAQEALKKIALQKVKNLKEQQKKDGCSI